MSIQCVGMWICVYIYIGKHDEVESMVKLFKTEKF